jgi:hypothetical protein
VTTLRRVAFRWHFGGICGITGHFGANNATAGNRYGIRVSRLLVAFVAFVAFLYSVIINHRRGRGEAVNVCIYRFLAEVMPLMPLCAPQAAETVTAQGLETVALSKSVMPPTPRNATEMPRNATLRESPPPPPSRAGGPVSQRPRKVSGMAKSDGRMGHRWRQIREQVLGTNNVCHLCGVPGADTVDHIIPLSLAPELAHDLSNLRPAHRSCNSRKGAKVGAAAQPRVFPRSRDW